jgi:hypothetical protein
MTGYRTIRGLYNIQDAMQNLCSIKRKSNFIYISNSHKYFLTLPHHLKHPCKSQIPKKNQHKNKMEKTWKTLFLSLFVSILVYPSIWYGSL